MEDLIIDFYNFDTSQLEMLLESNLIEFKKEIFNDKISLYISKEIVNMLFLNFGHLFDIFIISLEENQQIKVGNKNITNLSDFEEFL